MVKEANTEKVKNNTLKEKNRYYLSKIASSLPNNL